MTALEPTVRRPPASRFGLAEPGRPVDLVDLVTEPAALPPHPRRWRLLPVVVAVVALLAMLGAVLPGVLRDGPVPRVLVASRPLPAGTRVAAGDVHGVNVALPGTGAVSEGDIRLVVGRELQRMVPPGAVLRPDDLAEAPTPIPGTVLVGMALAPGRVPAAGLQPGDHVRAITVQTQPAPGPPFAADLLVVDSRPGADGGAVLTVQVPDAGSAVVANYAASGQLTLVLLARPAG